MIQPSTGIRRKACILRFAQTLGTLLRGGVPILVSLKLVQEHAENSVLAGELAHVYAAVDQGSRLEMPLRQCRVFPPEAIDVIAIREEAGQLDTVLFRLAQMYKEEVDHSISVFASVLEFAYEIPQVRRFRVNLLRQHKGVGAVFRLLPCRLYTLEELGLPQVVYAFIHLEQGLVLVTGPTGSGKSTTLAAIIDHINQESDKHIVTLEDPLEFIHPNKKSLVTQREVGVHTTSFAAALRAVLREDPDIILLGELRDLETISLAITAAETGHLVFGTLHTRTAASTVDRLIDVFPPEQQSQIRTMLAETLKGVITQQLLVRADGQGRVMAVEILVGTTALGNMIRESKTYQIPSLRACLKIPEMSPFARFRSLHDAVQSPKSL